MALTTGKNLGLLVNGAAGEEHYQELMRFFRGLDVLVQPVVISASVTSPPGSPVNGDAYIVPSGATGAWAGHDGKIARWTTDPTVDVWEFILPAKGWQAKVQSGVSGVLYEYTGSAWRTLGALPVYADQAAAASGGVVVGELFSTSDGAVMVKT